MKTPASDRQLAIVLSTYPGRAHQMAHAVGLDALASRLGRFRPGPLPPPTSPLHVVLPEVDGRLFAGLISHKSPGKRHPELQFSRFAHRADDGRIAAVVDRVKHWHRLATTPASDRQLAIVLSTYPGRAHQMAHAVGLDALASRRPIRSRASG
ncbi:cobaltochelatase subunit CobN [Mycobacterium tuberculosis]|uniref:cobaltochelatase subunit CobN n=1 Tax=Mycobacterium tuberculosis TaxID=1773 RepID=UPI002729680D|nr:cobaltochelatase subunit CobN [Mycobacterium tuberculosis]